MGHFTDETILRQEADALDDYLTSRDLTVHEAQVLLERQLRQIASIATTDVMMELLKHKGVLKG